MKSPRLAVLPLIFAAAPALATGGFDCRATDGSNVRMTGVIGHYVGASLAGATLHLGDRDLSTMDREPPLLVAQSWLDPERVWVDLVDSQRTRIVARLRVRVGEHWTGTGTLVHDGVTRPVRCALE